MNDREKMIALVRNLRRSVTPWHAVEDIADYLIAIGVVVREKGEWLHVCGKGRHAEYECSECKTHVCFDEKMGGDIPAYNFCPNCGADMTGGERNV